MKFPYDNKINDSDNFHKFLSLLRKEIFLSLSVRKKIYVDTRE